MTYVELRQAIEQTLQAMPLAELPRLMGDLEFLRATAEYRLKTTVEPSSEQLLSVPEAAQRLGLSEYRVYELIRQGNLKKTASGRRVLVHPSDLADYIARCRG